MVPDVPIDLRFDGLINCAVRRESFADDGGSVHWPLRGGFLWDDLDGAGYSCCLLLESPVEVLIVSLQLPVLL